MEIVQERLFREFGLELITTAPSVVYRLHTTQDEDVLELHNPADMPDVTKIVSMEEPWVRATIMVPDDYLGSVLQLCTERRGEQIDLTYVGSRAMAVYRLPLNEIVFDFYDRLKSISKGYASFDYEMDEVRRERAGADQHSGELQKRSTRWRSSPIDHKRKCAWPTDMRTL